MKKANITHRRMKWRMAMRIASLPEERWSRKTAEWNPGIDNCIKTNRSVGRQRKRWEDEINEFIRRKKLKNPKGMIEKTTKHGYSKQSSNKNGKRKKKNSQKAAAARRDRDR